MKISDIKATTVTRPTRGALASRERLSLGPIRAHHVSRSKRMKDWSASGEMVAAAASLLRQPSPR